MTAKVPTYDPLQISFGHPENGSGLLPFGLQTHK